MGQASNRGLYGRKNMRMSTVNPAFAHAPSRIHFALMILSIRGHIIAQAAQLIGYLLIIEAGDSLGQDILLACWPTWSIGRAQ